MQFYSVAKYNSGIVIVYEIFRKLLLHSGALRAKTVQFLLHR
ncbi:hypothetical protein AI2602V1_2802 [Citrobacter freundii]|nr:hypothetical protein AI2602V1_2802 [Citrobacter freundii]CAH3310554.1 hypothetical protein AI2602V1_2802 [Citrobacter freundii]CAH6003634.1 hypothetical protein AI3058V1_1389 [Citrobacter freundii]